MSEKTGLDRIVTTPDAERMAIFAEEMGEAQHIIGKVHRHGYESTDPTGRDLGTNRHMLAKEIGDLLFAVELLMASGDIDREAVRQRLRRRGTMLSRYLHCPENVELVAALFPASAEGGRKGMG